MELEPNQLRYNKASKYWYITRHCDGKVVEGILLSEDGKVSRAIAGRVSWEADDIQIDLASLFETLPEAKAVEKRTPDAPKAPLKRRKLVRRPQ
jgi:hypothetical protein